MPARMVIGAWAFVMAFFHLGQQKDSSAEMDQKLLDSINKSREAWVAKGWVEQR